MRLLTNNPEKSEALADFGVTVDAQVPLTPRPNPHNLRYLRTKRDRMGHTIPGLPAVTGRPPGWPGERRRGSGRRAVDGSSLRVGVVAARWHTQVMDGLLDGARRALTAYSVTQVTRGAGAGHLRAAGGGRRARSPPMTRWSRSASSYAGGTPHFDYVCSAATDGLTRVALDTRTPVGFGVLTCDDDDQALARAGLEGSTEDKGYEATAAALHTALTLRDLRA